MWRVISEEKLTCTECYHFIPSGEECLSQMPENMPDNVRRRNCENFCISCAKCNSNKDRPPCYVRRLNHWYVHKTPVEKPVSCVHCDETIPEGKRAFVQKFYAWPDFPGETVSDVDGISAGEGVLGISLAAKKPSVGDWRNLSPDVQSRLKNAGLGNGRGGARTAAEAERFYKSSIPSHVRNAGDPGVRDFTSGQDASHIKSVYNSPSQAKDSGNILWESAPENRARGSRNMSTREVGAAKLQSGLRGAKIGGREALKRGFRGGVIAGVVELPIASAENFLHWRRARKSGNQAMKDTANATVVTAGVAGAVGAAYLIPISLGPLAAPVAVLGGTLWIGKTIYRLANAAKIDTCLDELNVFFCNERICRSEFARAATHTETFQAITS